MLCSIWRFPLRRPCPAEPAHAARNNAWATARAIFRANMNEARFWIGVADQFAASAVPTGVRTDILRCVMSASSG